MLLVKHKFHGTEGIINHSGIHTSKRLTVYYRKRASYILLRWTTPSILLIQPPISSILQATSAPLRKHYLSDPPIISSWTEETMVWTSIILFPKQNVHTTFTNDMATKHEPRTNTLPKWNKINDCKLFVLWIPPVKPLQPNTDHLNSQASQRQYNQSQSLRPRRKWERVKVTEGPLPKSPLMVWWSLLEHFD